MIPVTLEQATFEVVIDRIRTFNATTSPSDLPLHTASDLIDFAIQGLDRFVVEHDEKRITDNQYGINVLGSLPVRCAEVSRASTPDEYLEAFRDPRTFAFTLGLLSMGDRGLAERNESQYGIAIEYLFAEPPSRLVHLEQDGSFFSLQPVHRELLQAHTPNNTCMYYPFMHQTSIAFAERMTELGIIRAILGKGL